MPLDSTDSTPLDSTDSMSLNSTGPPPIEAQGLNGQALASTDITDVSPLLATSDPVAQSEVVRGLMLEDERVQLGPDLEFRKQTVRNVYVSTLRRNFENKDKKAAMKLLLGRIKLLFPEGDIWDPNDPDVSFSPNKHFLDFLLAVPKSIGLHAIIPNTNVDHNYTFDFTINQRGKAWKAKHAELGFRPKGRMLHIGKAQGQNVWLAFAPLEFWDLDSLNADYDEDSFEKDGLMPEDRYRKVVYLMAHLFSIAGIAGVHNMETYPGNLTSKETDGWKVDTNIFKQHVYSLRLQDVRKLHDAMAENYTEWVENAPGDFFKDTFFRDCRPFVVACLFGQDQRICVQGEHNEERNIWRMERDYKLMKHVTVALATHVSCLPCIGKENLPLETIIEFNDGQTTAYTHWDPRQRMEVDLREMGIKDDGGNEIKLYTEDGFFIKRIGDKVYTGDQPPTILGNLRELAKLFQDHTEHLFDDIDDDESDGDYREIEEILQKITMYAYPQALTRHGNIQADFPMPVFLARILALNKTIRKSAGHNPLRCGHFQTYNYVSHVTRTSAQTHIAQNAPLTQLFAGTLLENPNSNSRFTKARVNSQLGSLPHAKLQHLIKSAKAEIAADYRLEVVVKIEMDDLDPRTRSGHRLYDNVICQIVQQWNHPSVFEALRPCLTIFRPGIFPDIYNWTTYGICCVLENLYEINKSLINAEPQAAAMSPFYVEMVSILERTFNFAHTGSSKVLIRSLMDGLWISQGIITDGYPAFHPRLAGVLTLNGYQPALDTIQSIWPRHRLGDPMEASKCAQIYSYGTEQWGRYFDRFRLFYAILNSSKDKERTGFFPELVYRPTETNAKFLTMAVVLVQSFVRDIVSNASAAITVKIWADSRVLPSAFNDPGATKSARLNQLKQWSMSSQPLLLSTHNTRMLVQAIVHEPDPKNFRLPECRAEFTLKDLAGAFCDMAQDPRNCKMPFTKRFSTTSLLPIAYKWFVENSRNMDENRILRRFRVFITLALINQKVERIPARTSGSRSQNDYLRWINVPSSEKESNSAVKDLNTEEEIPLVDGEEYLNREPWSTLDCKLRDLPRFVNRVKTPTNIKLENAQIGEVPYVTDTYKWVLNHFTVEDPVYHYALFVSIVASKTANKHRHDNRVPSELKEYEREEGKEASPNIITKFIRDTEWVSVGSGGSRSTKGRGEETQLTIGFLVQIIALLDDRSPLRQRMIQNNGAMGDDWTRKHSSKGINAFNLIRLGLANGLTKKAFKNAQYEFDWLMLKGIDIAKLDEIMMQLLPQPFGVFRWLMEVVGARRAIELDVGLPPGAAQLALDHRAQLWALPARLRSTTPAEIDRPGSPVKHIPRKHKRDEVIEISSDDDGVINVGAVETKRKRGNQTRHVQRECRSISPPGPDDLIIIPKKPRQYSERRYIN